MLLDQKQLSELVFGAYKINVSDGRLSFVRFEQQQLDRIKQLSVHGQMVRGSLVNASVSVEFITDAEELSFLCRFPEIKTDLDTMDILCDGVPAAVYPVASMPKGAGTVKVKFPAGRKHVAVYMPCDALAEIKDMNIKGSVEKVVKGDKVLFIGDSITQGYGTYLSSGTYVNTLCRLKNYNALNQGVGGYWYDEGSLVKLNGFIPDKIIIAMGTNQFKAEDKKERIQGFYKKFVKLYSGIPTLTITPIWREMTEEETPLFYETAEIIKEECAKYSIPVLDGLTLVPDSPRYFKDGLHPNATGALIYALNLAKEIEKLGF